VNYSSIIRGIGVSDLWNRLSAANGWVLPRTLISQTPVGGTGSQATSIGYNTSLGWGNYNGMFVSLRTTAWKGLTAISNFTYGRSLGTSQLAQYNSSSTPLDIFNLGGSYGPQNFDYKFIYNLSMYYQPPVFRGQHGVLGHVLGGWTISPIFTAQSGGGLSPSFNEYTNCDCEGFGEVTTPGTSAVSSTSENAVGFAPYTGNMSARYGNLGTNGACNYTVTASCTPSTNIIGNTLHNGINYNLYGFANPAQVYQEFRPCVLGFDTSCGGYYNLRGLPTWNTDANFIKDIGVYKERVGVTLSVLITNIFNHFQPGSPAVNLSSPGTFGQITGSGGAAPRSMEFALRVHW
jgi:hypothetical protein